MILVHQMEAGIGGQLFLFMNSLGCTSPVTPSDPLSLEAPLHCLVWLLAHSRAQQSHPGKEYDL